MSESFNYLLRIGKVGSRGAGLQEAQSSQSFLCVELNEKPLFIGIDNVREVSSSLELFPLGHTQAWFKGITKFQGDIFSVFDVGYFLFGSLSKTRQRTAVAFTQEAGNYAMLVDRVQGIQRLRNLKPVSEVTSDFIDVFIDEEDKEVRVLDVNALTNSDSFLNPALF